MIRKIVIAIAAVCITVAMQAQTDVRKEQKEARKEQNAQLKEEWMQKRSKEKKLAQLEDSLRFVQAVQALKNLDFVLESNKLQFKRGETAFVNDITNFVAMHDNKATVQVAPFNGGGPNGVGGVTVDGRASDITMRTDRKGNVIFHANITGNGISAMIDITLYEGNNRASVVVNPNFNSNKITLYGTLIPSKLSTIFKGMPL